MAKQVYPNCDSIDVITRSYVPNLEVKTVDENLSAVTTYISKIYIVCQLLDSNGDVIAVKANDRTYAKQVFSGETKRTDAQVETDYDDNIADALTEASTEFTGV